MKKFRCVSKVSAAIAAGVMATASVSMPVFAEKSSSSAEYYARVVHKNAASEAKKISAFYKKMCKAALVSDSTDGSAAVKVSVEPGAEICDLWGIKEGTALNLIANANYLGDSLSGDIALNVNSNEIIKLSCAEADNVFYGSIPTISSSWLSATQEQLSELIANKVNETAADFGIDDTVNVTAAPVGKITFFDGNVLTEERVERIITTYTDIFLKHADDVKVKSGVEVTAGDLSDAYSVASVNLSGSDLYSLSSEVLNTASRDRDIYEIWKSFGLSADAYKEFFKGAKQNLRDSRADFKDISVAVDYYFNSKGKVMGQNVSVNSESDPSSSTEFYTLTVQDGDKTSAEGGLKLPAGSCKYSASTTESADGKTNVKGRISVKHNTFDENGNSEIEKQNYSFSFSGTDNSGIFKMSGVLSDTDKFTLQAVGDKTSANARLIYYSNDRKYLTVKIFSKTGEAKEVTIPTENVINVAESEKYLATIDPTALAANIESVRGDLGDALTDVIIEMVQAFFAAPEAEAAA